MSDYNLKRERNATARVRPIFRVLAGLGCLAFLALGVLFFPFAGLAEHPWRLVAPLSAVVGDGCCGNFALFGQWPRR